VLLGFLACLRVTASPAAALDTQAVEKIVRADLKTLQVPSASVAIVLDAQVAYAEAFGLAQLNTGRAATKSARYEIGSISKQFLATALLMLQEQGRLSLDDKAGKYLPDLGPASEVTLRQLLSHTAGLRDYCPQDYVFTRMLSPISRDELLDTWARQPLDFQPGTRWQYSSTGYTVAGVIFEKVSGEPLFGYLRQRVFIPLRMDSVVNVDEESLSPADAVGYTRAALGPVHPALHEGKGWMFAAGELAMTAEDLARWDISIIDQSLMKAASYRQLETETMLADGVGSGYALGLGVRMTSERRVLRHGGGTSGFISMNVIYPDQRAAIVVLTNSDSADAAGAIASKLADVVFEYTSPIDESRRAEARRIFDGLRQGQLDRSLLTENASAYFTPATVQDIAHGLAPLGPVKSFRLVSVGTRGGLDARYYQISLARRDLALVTRAQPDGKLEQYVIVAK
jgi:CubicO group peptidase (beta-lactamase class C family)